MKSPRARCIAFYLPAFYPFPENDTWWGKGFTEWWLVRERQPLFKTHQQPRVPDENLGYYNTLDADTRRKQAQMAKDCGIEAFCYWHMWFGHGKQLLHETVKEVMQSGEPHMPFCLAWANQTWTRRWARTGTISKTLMEQTYPGDDDIRAHFATVLPMFQDPRYLRMHNQPLFILYKPFAVPDLERFIALWNTLARDAGIPGIFFLGMIAPHEKSPTVLGLHGFIRHQPATDLMRYGQSVMKKTLRGNVMPLLRFLRGALRRPQVFDHGTIVQSAMTATLEQNEYLQVLTNWDDTPRQGKNGTIFQGSTPDHLQSVMLHAVKELQSRPQEERLLFLKSWNEWGEGNYIEPDTQTKNGYLDAVRAVLRGDDTSTSS